jgi:hypothetical protein
MLFNKSNFLQFIKDIVTGSNVDDTPVSGGLLPGTNTTNLSSGKSADGGIKVDQTIPLPTVGLATLFPLITDNTTGVASTTFGAIAGATYATDAPAIKNALAEIAAILNAAHYATGVQVSSVPVISITAGTTQPIGTFSFPIPRDYDEASDHLNIRLAIELSNAADIGAVSVSGVATVQPIATGVASTKTLVNGTLPFQTTTFLVTTTETVVDLNFSGYGLKRDDVISIAIALVGTNADPVYVYFVEKSYDSTIVSYNETDTTDNPSTSGLLPTIAPSGAVANILPGFGNPLR